MTGVFAFILTMLQLNVIDPGTGGRSSPPGESRVQPGIDVLRDQGFAFLRGKRVGLITNPTGVTADLEATIDVLHKAQGVALVALLRASRLLRVASAGAGSGSSPGTGVGVVSSGGGWSPPPLPPVNPTRSSKPAPMAGPFRSCVRLQ